MGRRYLSIWFRHLTTDWHVIKQPELGHIPFILSVKQGNRQVVAATNALAEKQGISAGMASADAKAVIPGLHVIDEPPGLNAKLLNALAHWCLRYTPIIAVDMPDGLLFDITGCAHLWGGEREYLKKIVNKLRHKGYDARAAIADTAGAAWAVARYGKITPIIPPREHAKAIMGLPPAALRLDALILDKLQKLGLRTIGHFAGMKRSALRRRFGDELLLRLDHALGNAHEYLTPIQPIEPFHERLPCMEPIKTAPGIAIAIRKLLEMLCLRLQKEGKGLRTGVLKIYRIDGEEQQVQIGTNRPVCQVEHLFKLFEMHIEKIEPDLGIELFVLEAPKTDDVSPDQEELWSPDGTGIEDAAFAELLDRISGKYGANVIKRYLPQEHHWPERAVKLSRALDEKPQTEWFTGKMRPTQLLPVPQPITVAAPVPDYPPMLFVYQQKTHHIKKADGPERIEREWWLEEGEHRDYYMVEDELGQRYWLFRSGHYTGDRSNNWYLHGYMA